MANQKNIVLTGLGATILILVVINIFLALFNVTGILSQAIAWLIAFLIVVGGLVLVLFTKKKFDFGRRIEPVVGLGILTVIFAYLSVSGALSGMFVAMGVAWIYIGLLPVLWGVTILLFIATLIGALVWLFKR